MSIYKANTKIGNIYKGTTKIGKIYKGSNLIYSAGYWLTKTGYPCTLTNSLGKALKDYKIYGNSTQNGTPTPTTPIEVVSLGESSKNLFNKSTALLGKDLVITTGGVYNNAERFTSDFIPVAVGITYYINYQVVKYGCFYDSSKVFLGTGSYFAGRTFIPPAGTAYVKFSGLQTELDTLQLEVGDTETEYKPYRYVDSNISGKNLSNTFMVAGMLKSNDGTIQNSSTWMSTGNYSYIYGLNKITISANSYTFGRTNEINIIAWYDINKIFLSYSGIGFGVLPRTVSVPSGAYYCRIRLSKSQNDDISLLTDFQIENGENATDYEPYQESTTTIDMTPSKNLFDANSLLTLQNNNDGTYTVLEAPNNKSNAAAIYLKANTTYTWSLYVNNLTSGGSISVRLYNEAGTVIKSSYFSSLGNNNYSFSVDTDGMYYVLNGAQSVASYGSIISKLQIEESSIATDYVPYFSGEPLRKIGNVSDYIDYKNGKIIRNIGKIVYDGSDDEGWINGTGSFANSCYSVPKTFSGGTFISNHFVQSTVTDIVYSTIGYGYCNNSGKFLHLNYDNLGNNSQSFKNWLSTNNVELYYVLATPVEEDITLPLINTFKETNVISAYDNKLNSSNISVTYKSSKNI